MTIALGKVGKAEPKPVAGKPVKRWYVSLGTHGPTSEHIAANSDDAWEAYKKQHGILASEFAPEIVQMRPGQTIEELKAERADKGKGDGTNKPANPARRNPGPGHTDRRGYSEPETNVLDRRQKRELGELSGDAD